MTDKEKFIRLRMELCEHAEVKSFESFLQLKQCLNCYKIISEVCSTLPGRLTETEIKKLSDDKRFYIPKTLL